jgi:5-methylthioadenosine/S-adenosylhomocysteine deaminase
MDAHNSIIKNGGLAVKGNTIIELGDGAELCRKHPQAQIIQEKHGLIMPGLINAHTHSAMSCFRGLADDLPLMQWLQEYIFPAEAQITGEIVYHSTLLSICEMIRSGTTSFCDMYLFADEVAKAAAAAGIRAWIGEVLYDFPSPNYGNLENGFLYTDTLFNTYQNHDLVKITVDPHSVYTCSPDLLKRLGTVAQEHNALYVIHLSETKDEIKTCKERFDCTPVQHLKNLGLLNERVVADHCVTVNSEDITILADLGVKVVHCIESNMKLASGIAPIPEMLAAGITVGLGTDGSASNNDVDMFGEMNTVAKVHKVHKMDPTVMNSLTTLQTATRGSAAALCADRKIGSLEPGKKADCIVIDCNQPHLTPMYNPISHLVYAARGSDVLHSIINGRIVMENQILKTIDEQSVLTEMQRIAGDIRQLMR